MKYKTFELAISTMHKTKDECIEMIKKENISVDLIIINQCDIDDFDEFFLGNQHIRLFYTTERGLSKSRNMALRNMQADIMAIGDDDLVYFDNIDKIILNYYNTNSQADVVVFNIDDFLKKFPVKPKKCHFFDLLGFKSFQITFNKSIQGILFNEYFGTGSKYAQHGEENIFLADAWRHRLNIFYSSVKILKRERSESSWFKGYTESYFNDKGAVLYKISPLFFVPFILFFAFRIRKKVNYRFSKIISFMRKGRHDYLLYQKHIGNK